MQKCRGAGMIQWKPGTWGQNAKGAVVPRRLSKPPLTFGRRVLGNKYERYRRRDDATVYVAREGVRVTRTPSPPRKRQRSPTPITEEDVLSSARGFFRRIIDPSADEPVQKMACGFLDRVSHQLSLLFDGGEVQLPFGPYAGSSWTPFIDLQGNKTYSCEIVRAG